MPIVIDCVAKRGSGLPAPRAASIGDKRHDEHCIGFRAGAERGARAGKHPRTGQPIHIPASRVPRFSAGAKLKQAVNG